MAVCDHHDRRPGHSESGNYVNGDPIHCSRISGYALPHVFRHVLGCFAEAADEGYRLSEDDRPIRGDYHGMRKFLLNRPTVGQEAFPVRHENQAPAPSSPTHHYDQMRMCGGREILQQRHSQLILHDQPGSRRVGCALAVEKVARDFEGVQDEQL